jgi:HSP20 family protein
MKLTRCNPYTLTDFDSWFRQPFAGFPSASQLFSAAGSNSLAADIHEDKDNYFAQFEVPGVKKEELKVELNNQILTVSAEKNQSAGDNEQSFSLTRSISVPDGVQGDAISAKLENGILTVTLPKAEHRKPKAIEIA